MEFQIAKFILKKMCVIANNREAVFRWERAKLFANVFDTLALRIIIDTTKQRLKDVEGKTFVDVFDAVRRENPTPALTKKRARRACNCMSPIYQHSEMLMKKLWEANETTGETVGYLRLLNFVLSVVAASTWLSASRTYKPLIKGRSNILLNLIKKCEKYLEAFEVDNLSRPDDVINAWENIYVNEPAIAIYLFHLQLLFHKWQLWLYPWLAMFDESHHYFDVFGREESHNDYLQSIALEIRIYMAESKAQLARKQMLLTQADLETTSKVWSLC